MSDLLIGRLERVALREVWRHEAYDFTRWLQDNVEILSETLNLNVVNVDREQAAGPFSIDLVAEEDGSGKIVIENQLEKSNHDHLGKLLTYMVAMDARKAVWIVAEPRPEHVAAIAWLNDSSSAEFYLIKVEAVRIGASPPAPLLTLIVGPSAETEAISRSKKEFAQQGDLRHEWWKKLVERPDAKLHRHITPGAYTWIGATAGALRGLNLNYWVQQHKCLAELYIDRGKGAEEENKAIFDQLSARKEAIEASFGGPLEWQRLDAKRACRITATMPGGYKSPPEEWDAIQARQVDAMNRLNAALQPHLKTLRIS